MRRAVVVWVLGLVACGGRERPPRQPIDVDLVDPDPDPAPEPIEAPRLVLTGVDSNVGSIEVAGVDRRVGVSTDGDLILKVSATPAGTTVEIDGKTFVSPEPPGLEVRVTIPFSSGDRLIPVFVTGAGGERIDRSITIPRADAELAILFALGVMPHRIVDGEVPPPRSIAWRGRLFAGAARNVREVDLVAFQNECEVEVFDRRTGKLHERHSLPAPCPLEATENWLRGLVP